MTSDEDRPAPKQDQAPLQADFGLFIGADGVNSSVPWKIADYGSRGALSEEALAEIVEGCGAEFCFSETDLQRLSRALAIALDHEAFPFLYGVSRSDAHDRGVKKLEAARTQMAKASTAVIKARKKMHDLTESLTSIKHEAAMKRYFRALQEAEALLVDVSKGISSINPKNAPPSPKFKNRRHVPDIRRRNVVLTSYQFLMETGNRHGFTTDLGTNERTGGLMAFLDLVVPHITDPPSKLSKDTVARDLTAMRQLPDINDD